MVTRFLNSLTLVRISEIRFYHKHVILKVSIYQKYIMFNLSFTSIVVLTSL